MKFIFTTDIQTLIVMINSLKSSQCHHVSSAAEVEAIRFTKIFLFQSSYVKLSVLNRRITDADAAVICILVKDAN